MERLKLRGDNYFALGTLFPGEVDDAGTSNKGYLRLIRPEQQWPSGVWVSEVVGQWTAPGCVQDVKAVWDHIAIAVDYGVRSLEILATAFD